MKDVLRNYKLVGIAYSGGKDSSIVAAKTLSALIELKKAGLTVPKLLISSSDTGIENPEVHNHLVNEHAKIRAYCEEHGLEVETKLVQPGLARSFVGRLLTGQMLPVFANTKSRTCTTSWKTEPQERFLKKYLKENGLSKADVITLVGTRVSESQVRAKNMRAVGTDKQTVSKNDQGFNIFAPIALMTTDDVWLYIAEVVNGMRHTYSDFVDLMRIYKDANGECVLVSDNLSSQKQGRACGARHGCYLCLAGSMGGENSSRNVDKSLTNMIEATDEHGNRPYAYLETLTKIQQFMAATQYDLSRRNWVGRTVKAHNEKQYIGIAPDTYSGEMLLELLQYLLTAQAIEEEESNRLGIEPRFTIISESELVYLDARWSERGLNKPFTAFKAWDDVMIKGLRFYPSENLFYERKAIPKKRYIEIENLDSHLRGMKNGFDEYCEIDFDASSTFSVDQESAEMALYFYRDKLNEPVNRRYAYGMQFWTGLGTLTQSKGKVGAVTGRMALTNALEEQGLLAMSNQELYESAIEIQFNKTAKEKVCEIPVLAMPSQKSDDEQLTLFSA